jgi:hypothetical protein
MKRSTATHVRCDSVRHFSWRPLKELGSSFKRCYVHDALRHGNLFPVRTFSLIWTNGQSLYVWTSGERRLASDLPPGQNYSIKGLHSAKPKNIASGRSNRVNVTPSQSRKAVLVFDLPKVVSAASLQGAKFLGKRSVELGSLIKVSL